MWTALSSSEAGTFLAENVTGCGRSLNQSDDELVFKFEMPLSISSVEKMYRWLGLRHVCGEDDVAGLSTNAPPNCPDNETDDRNFVFVHGYNVGPEAARGWGVSSWYGTDPTYYIYGSGFREKANTLDRATAVIAPLFTRFSAEREAMQSTNLFVVADADYARELKAKFLADAIPAESFAAGANALTAWGESRNYNFQSKIPNGWPKLDDDDNPVWEHSDLKNVAYFYVYELFKKVVKETR